MKDFKNYRIIYLFIFRVTIEQLAESLLSHQFLMQIIGYLLLEGVELNANGTALKILQQFNESPKKSLNFFF